MSGCGWLERPGAYGLDSDPDWQDQDVRDREDKWHGRGVRLAAAPVPRPWHELVNTHARGVPDTWQDWPRPGEEQAAREFLLDHLRRYYRQEFDGPITDSWDVWYAAWQAEYRRTAEEAHAAGLAYIRAGSELEADSE